MKPLEGIKALIAAFAVFVLACIFLPIGIIHTTISSIFNIKNLGEYWFNFCLEIWLVITRFYFYIGLSIDYLGNVVCGPLLINLISKKGWYKKNKHLLICGKSGITLSSAIGQVQYHDSLNKAGVYLTIILNKAFNESDHSLDSYLRYINNCNCN